MTIAFVGLFFVGLIAAVRVMLYGVERQRALGDDSPRSFSVSPAVIAGFCIVAGIVGYLLSRSGLPTLTVALTAAGAGLITAVATARAVARWWTVVPEHDVDDERYILQGSFARVVADIGERGLGQVSLVSDAVHRVLRRHHHPEPVLEVDADASTH